MEGPTKAFFFLNCRKHICIQYKTLVYPLNTYFTIIFKNPIIVRHNTRPVIIPGSTLTTNEKWVGIGTLARNGGSFLECDMSPGPNQREACPSIVSSQPSASDERMPQWNSTYVSMKTLHSARIVTLNCRRVCVCACVFVCACMFMCVCLSLCSWA